MILPGLILASSMYLASPKQGALPPEFPMLPHCDSTRPIQESDHGSVELDPTLDSDTLTRVPPLKTKTRHFGGDEDEVYQFYVGKRGKEIKHGLYQRVTRGNGKVMEAGYYSHNQPIGHWTAWYYTGEVQTESDYRSGKRNGKLISYHKNGLIFEKQDLVNGLPSCEEGYSFGYHENGKLNFEVRVRNGYVIQESRYDTLGMPIVKKVHPKK